MRPPSNPGTRALWESMDGEEVHVIELVGLGDVCNADILPAGDVGAWDDEAGLPPGVTRHPPVRVHIPRSWLRRESDDA